MLLIFMGTSAWANTVDFSDSNGGCVAPRVFGGPGSFTDQGLTFSTSAGYMYTVDGSQAGCGAGANNGTNFLIDGYGTNSGFGTTTITEAGSNPFNLQQLDLGVSYFASSPQTITIEGFVHGGGVLTDTVTIDNIAFSTIVLGWSNLDSVLVPAGTDGYTAIDNVVYNTAAPEPTSFALLGVGLAGLGLLRRRLSRTV